MCVLLCVRVCYVCVYSSVCKGVRVCVYTEAYVCVCLCVCVLLCVRVCVMSVYTKVCV